MGASGRTLDDGTTAKGSDMEGLPPGSLAPDGHVPGQLTLVDLLYAPAVAAAAESASSSAGAYTRPLFSST